MTTMNCVVDDCPFMFDADAREEYEQHVRWIHLARNDFGDNPIPALSMLLLNGILRPEEFGQQLQRVVDGVQPTVPRPIAVMYGVLAAAWFGGLAGLMMVAFSVPNKAVASTESVGFMLIAVGLGLFGTFAAVSWDEQRGAHRSVHVGIVPPTTEDPATTTGGDDDH